ncbi:MAG: cyclic nucleotide-binding domain-containing protein [Pseudomonadota bacterium]
MSDKVSEKLVARARAVQILKKLPVFSGLLEDEYFKILAMCTSTTVEAGEQLFRQGDDGSSMFTLLAGRVEILIEGKGVVHTMQAGEIIGEMGLVKKITRTATAVVKERSVLLQLYAEVLHDIVGKYPRIGYVVMRNVAGILAERVIAANKKAVAQS